MRSGQGFPSDLSGPASARLEPHAARSCRAPRPPTRRPRPRQLLRRRRGGRPPPEPHRDHARRSRGRARLQPVGSRLGEALAAAPERPRGGRRRVAATRGARPDRRAARRDGRCPDVLARGHRGAHRLDAHRLHVPRRPGPRRAARHRRPVQRPGLRRVLRVGGLPRRARRRLRAQAVPTPGQGRRDRAGERVRGHPGQPGIGDAGGHARARHDRAPARVRPRGTGRPVACRRAPAVRRAARRVSSVARRC
jgi:hypothetical protein